MVNILEPSHHVLFNALPFERSNAPVGYDNDWTYVAVSSGDKSYRLILDYVANHLRSSDDHVSFQLESGKKKSSRFIFFFGGDDDDDDATKKKNLSSVVAGLGLHAFEWESQTFHCLRQMVGTPVGTNCGAVYAENLVLFAPRRAAEPLLQAFVDQLVAAAEATTKGVYKLFRWYIRRGMWKDAQKVRARSMDSVMLPRATKAKLVADLDAFVSDAAETFYASHGIPYKRSYLFHGVPGAGKTSLIQAIAGHYARNMYFLQPTHPKLTDDGLRSAIEQIPANSVVVFEDIDALFSKTREKKVADSPLTFSGLLNALDGVGSPDGHIVILTTNFRHQLDDALVRNGRVDVHVAFDYAVAEQIEDMFAGFYPSERKHEFAVKLQAALGTRNMSTAALQHYFVTQRTKSVDEAMANVGEIVRDIDERLKDEEKTKMEEEAKEKEEEEAKKKLAEGEAK
ncbi:hypothetical protein As57867_002881, partial [Aphanomyces stellatus]